MSRDGIEYRRWPSAPDYWAGADGSIIGMSGRKLSMTNSSNGYLSVTPIVDGRKVTRSVHTIVAESWHGPAPSARHQVAHVDGDSANNRATNLEWKTPAQNNADKTAHGAARGGVDNNKAKLTWQLVNDIRDRAARGHTGARLARETGVDSTTIYAVIKHETWVRPGEARTVGARRRWNQARHAADAAPPTELAVVAPSELHAAWCPDAMPEIVTIEGVRYRRWPTDPHFLCGEDGSVIGVRGRKLSPHQHGRYLYVGLTRGRVRLVHRVIAEAWLEPPPVKGMHVLHGPGGSLDNRPSNLRWGTQQQNMADKRRDGTHVEGEKQRNALLTATQVITMREDYAAGRGSQSDLARRYSVTREAVRSVVRGKAWKHVGGPVTQDGRAIRASTHGEKHHSSRLTVAAVRAIRRDYAAGGTTLAALGARHGVSGVAVSAVVRRKTWAHVRDGA